MINPNAILVVAITTTLGYLLGSWPLGLLAGLLIVAYATFWGRR